jgi:hypothetical protein
LVNRAQQASFGFVGDLLQERGPSLVWFAECEAAVPYRPIVVVHARSFFTWALNRNQRLLLSLMSAVRVNRFGRNTRESRPEGLGNSPNQ